MRSTLLTGEVSEKLSKILVAKIENVNQSYIICIGQPKLETLKFPAQHFQTSQLNSGQTENSLRCHKSHRERPKMQG